MIHHQKTFDSILKNNSLMTPMEVKNVLILHMARANHIGDISTKADKLRYFKSYFANARVDANFIARGGKTYYNDLLKHNPYLNSITSLELEEIDFDKYDVVFCASQNETELLQRLHEKHIEQVEHDRFRLAVFSISALLLERTQISQFIFPICEGLYRQVDYKPGEIYLTDEERIWANQWLEANGLQAGESLYIVLDSTSNPIKLIRPEVYFEYLKYLLKRERIKVLIFDERSIGKEKLYSEWLNEQERAKMIFCELPSLREAMCILGSDHTAFLFGPCTGLVHCISSIFNNYLVRGMHPDDIPVIITYTGIYDIDDSANNWWGGAPLVNCLLLKWRFSEVRPYWLKELPEDEKKRLDTLPCCMYTADMLIARTASLLEARDARRVEA